MRRFVTLLILLLSSIPFGVSISGCSHTLAPTYCNGGDSGMTTNDVASITMQPVVTGISLNYAEMGQISTPAATNCKGSSASVTSYTYATTDMTIADVQTTTGKLCAGTWNRNTGGGIADYTYCTPTNKSGIAYVSASADGVSSNPIPIFVHPVVTSIVFGDASTNCTTDPATNCCPLTTGTVVTAPAYSPNSCISQGSTAQIISRVFAGTTNITCNTGHLSYTAQGATSSTSISPVLSIDQNGVATANLPGSVLVSANISNAASAAGYFSTCPPASIILAAPNATSAGTAADPVIVNENNTQSLVATVLDTKGVTLTGLDLEYVSTTPATIPAGTTGAVTPILAGSAAITAICQPSTCNPAPINQVGLFGNGKPVTSNSVSIKTPGTNSTVLYMASTQSQNVEQIDFTTSVVSSPFHLPYVPNSMVLSTDGSTIYLGSSTELMVLSAVNSLSMSRVDINSPGVVLAVSPDSSYVILTDPVRQTITVESSSGSIVSTYGGVGTHAEFAPDSQTAYITAGNELLVYSGFTGWTSASLTTPATDVAITVPSVGAFFAGSPTTSRSYCATSVPFTSGGVTIETNSFFPSADITTGSNPNPTATTDRIAATKDGQHILGVTASTTNPTLSDLRLTLPTQPNTSPATPQACPLAGTLSFPYKLSTTTLNSVTATAITGVIPASDSSVAFVTYTGTGGVLPAYSPVASGLGTTKNISLSGSATAPIVGVISTDNSTLYVGTSGDNLIHLITPNATSGQWTDNSTLTPSLTSPAGAVVPVNLLAQKPRKTT
jgi:hypothetical protein